MTKKRELKLKGLYKKITEEELIKNDDAFVVIYNLTASKFYPVKRKYKEGGAEKEEDIIYGIYADDEYLFDAVIVDKKQVKRYGDADEITLTDKMTIADRGWFVDKFRKFAYPNVDDFIYMVFKRIPEVEDEQ